MGYHSAVKRNELPIHTAARMTLRLKRLQPLCLPGVGVERLTMKGQHEDICGVIKPFSTLIVVVVTLQYAVVTIYKQGELHYM